MKIIKNLTADQLRKSILQLAIQGKLVKQDPNDEPASELVKRIRDEKHRLIQEGKIKKDKNESFIFKGEDNRYYEKIGSADPAVLDNLPFELPNGWFWIRQSNLCWLDNGEKTKAGQLPYWEAKAIRSKKADSTLNEGVVVDPTFRLILVDGENSGEILIPPAKGYMGSTFKILRVTDQISFEYLLLLFEINRNLYKNNKVGAAIPHLNKKLFKDNLIALPPLSEQKRIVQKTRCFDVPLFKYRKIETNLSELESNFEKKLKASILQYAIEGKLVKQDPNDEPASELLERIKEEKERLIKEGKIKRYKHDSEIVPTDDKDYYRNIPEKWLIAKINDLGFLNRGSGIKRSNIKSTGMPCIRYGEIYTTYDTLLSKPVSHISSEVFDKCKKAKQGDILMTLTGENKTDIAKAVAYLGDDEIAFGGDITCLHCPLLNPIYLVEVLNSSFCVKQKRKVATGDIIIHISNDKLGQIKVPIPPKAEQDRIITKLAEVKQILLK